MITGLRNVFVGLLTFAVTFGLVAVVSNLTQRGDCTGSAYSALEPCGVHLMHMLGPGRHELAVALACAMASMIAPMFRVHTPVSETRRTVRWLAAWGGPVVLAVGLLVLQSLFDPSGQDLASRLTAGVLLLGSCAVGLRVARLWAALQREREDAGERTVIPFRQLLTLVLTGVVLTIGTATILANFAGDKHMPHVSAGSVVLSAALYALGSAVLLVLAHFVSMRSLQPAHSDVREGRVGVRWFRASSLLLAAIVLIAAVAPVASEGTVGLVGAAYRHLTSVKQQAGASCATDHTLCGRRDSNTDRRGTLPKHKPKRAKQAAGIDVTRTVVQVALWLVPLLLILYFVWERRRRQGSTGLWLLLQSLWRRLWGHTVPWRVSLAARSPGALADLASAARLRHRGASDLAVREQIIRYYLNAVRYAQTHGIARRPAQTPEEFEQTLLQHLHAGQEAWTSLTTDFIEARYNRDPLLGGQPERARSAWRATRAAIRAAAKLRSHSGA